MSSYFSKVIKAGDRQREFNFRLASMNDPDNYIVDVPDDKGNRIQFTMTRDNRQNWRISSGLIPAWVEATAHSLAEAIEENMANESLRRR